MQLHKGLLLLVFAGCHLQGMPQEVWQPVWQPVWQRLHSTQQDILRAHALASAQVLFYVQRH